jgi:hypothetical protein
MRYLVNHARLVVVWKHKEFRRRLMNAFRLQKQSITIHRDDWRRRIRSIDRRIMIADDDDRTRTNLDESRGGNPCAWR